MPKIKTHKGAKKRLKKTGSGNYKHRKANSCHIFTKKSAKRKQRLGSLGMVKACDKYRIDQMLPA
ncbi:MAG: 50S ribosomal protein L35 [Gammaproteobacteria bacterium]|jgi:large subunit ribosomal protein L35